MLQCGRNYEECGMPQEKIPGNGLEWKVSYLDDEEIDPDVDGCDISTWQPDPPAGNGWFVGSIHDTEDGAVCIWLRNVQDGHYE